MERKEWDVVTLPKLAAFVAGAAGFFALVLSSTPGFVLVVDHANLLFHEAGHPLVGLFSRRLEPYGGTLAQLVFPSVLIASFWRKREPIPLAAAAIWFFENWLNIGRYMADARALELPLLGGGEHDWNTIFTRWGVLQYDVQIAWIVKAAGWAGMAMACAWVFWRAGQDYQRAQRQNAVPNGDPQNEVRPGRTP